jgi:hypothetical protein
LLHALVIKATLPRAFADGVNMLRPPLGYDIGFQHNEEHFMPCAVGQIRLNIGDTCGVYAKRIAARPAFNFSPHLKV